jgi:hypothetical protein
MLDASTGPQRGVLAAGPDEPFHVATAPELAIARATIRQLGLWPDQLRPSPRRSGQKDRWISPEIGEEQGAGRSPRQSCFGTDGCPATECSVLELAGAEP